MKVDGISIIEADVDNEPLHSIYLDGKLLWGMFTYTLLNDGTYSVKATNKSIAGDIVIPSTYNGKAVTQISEEGFEYCNGITSVVIPNSITTVNRFAFRSCEKLTSVKISNSVTLIDNYAFSNCFGLTTAYYEGTEAEWDDAYMWTDGNSLLIKVIYFYSETRPTTEGNYWRYVDGVPTVWVAETYNLTITIGTTSYKMVGSGSMTSGKVANISNCPANISSVQTLQITVGAVYTYTGYMKLSLGTYTNANCTLVETSSGVYTLTISGATGDVSVQINGTAP